MAEDKDGFEEIDFASSSPVGSRQANVTNTEPTSEDYNSPINLGEWASISVVEKIEFIVRLFRSLTDYNLSLAQKIFLKGIFADKKLHKDLGDAWDNILNTRIKISARFANPESIAYIALYSAHLKDRIDMFDALPESVRNADLISSLVKVHQQKESRSFQSILKHILDNTPIKMWGLESEDFLTSVNPVKIEAAYPGFIDKAMTRKGSALFFVGSKFQSWWFYDILQSKNYDLAEKVLE